MTTDADDLTTTTGTGVRNLVVHASVALVAAHLVVVLLHELAHVAAGVALGFSNELFPFGVVHSPEPDDGRDVVMLLAGPVFSLVTGLLAMTFQPFRRGPGQAHLLWLWFAGMSTMEGIGYLMLTPFGVGDTGTAADLLDVPALVSWGALAVAVLGTVGTARWFAGPAVRHTAGDLGSLRAFTFYPWIVGTVVVLALNALNLVLVGDALGPEMGPGVVVAVLMGAFALGVFAPMAMPFTTAVQRRDPGAAGSEPMALPRVPVLGLVLLVVVVLVNLVVLVPGLRIG
ncbi:zinc metalloprotease [Ornithinimicrobium avium]|uniref:Uncharacterized protein n=1 Tax=Ornithinimicrobium avium TaxID=2283195 RepID=A0A345NQ84_9MICO|nr:hypothetical protein [Ornithinimicrobium avium]AXH97192.1 hypothetical protein DV701_14660 [Ornithinimicrobium avium]